MSRAQCRQSTDAFLAQLARSNVLELREKRLIMKELLGSNDFEWIFMVSGPRSSAYPRWKARELSGLKASWLSGGTVQRYLYRTRLHECWR